MFGLGVNGIHAQHGYAYLTNTGRKQYSRVPIDEKGFATGQPELLTNASITPDDFALTGRGDGAFIADNSLNVIQYTSGKGDAKALTNVGNPTAVRLGRLEQDRGSIFFSNSGDRAAFALMPIPTGGSISKLQIR